MGTRKFTASVGRWHFPGIALNLDNPFVSRNKDRIVQAQQDWKAGKFGKVVGDEKKFIPVPLNTVI